MAVGAIRSSSHVGVGFGAKPMPRTEPRAPSGRPIVTPYPRPKAQPLSSPTQPKAISSPSSGGFNKVLMSASPYQLSPPFNKQVVRNTLEVAPPTPDLSRLPKKRKKTKRRKKWQQTKSPVVEAIARTSQEFANRCSLIANEIGEYQRQQRCKERIAECIINLKAASERSLKLKTYQSELLLDGESSSCTTTNGALRDMVGDVGLALFSPLDLESFEPLVDRKDDSSTSSLLQVEDDHLRYPVELLPECPSILASCPRLLTPTMMEELVESLPATVKTMKWARIYSLTRDGDDFDTLLEKCHAFTNTIVCMETSRSEILGGYAAASWDKQGGTTRSFYGSGQSFLFCTHPDGGIIEDSNGDQLLHVFPWTGSNTYCQVCDVENGQLAMGGGGSFGFIVQDNFMVGVTGHCSTFDNPPLCYSGGKFGIVRFEVYGFSRMETAFLDNKPVRSPSLLLAADSPLTRHRKAFMGPEY